MVFADYIKAKKKLASEKEIISKCNADELLCLAYLKAMDNYFEVDEAIKYANTALLKNPKSYTFQIIAALIKAQKAMDSDWCLVYKLANDVRKNTSLQMDMNEDAIKIIFEYMELYECKQ